MKRCIPIVVLLLTFSACHHRRVPATALPPPTAPAPVERVVELPPVREPEPTVTPEPPAPEPKPVVNPLDLADGAFDAGNYLDAARKYEAYLQHEPSGDRRDQALFRLALS